MPKKPPAVTCQIIELQGVRYAVLPEPALAALCRAAGRTLSADRAGGTPAELELDRRRLADRIVLRRKRAGLSQVELARRAGIRAETLNRIERARTDPDFATLRQLVVAMNQAEAALPME